MSGSITVPGGGGTTITQTFSNTFNQALAKSIADALAAANSARDLFITTVSGSGTAPPNNSGKLGELVIEPGTTGSVSVPAGLTGYQFVVDDSAGPDTIFGSPGQSIMAGAGIHTIVDPSVITLSDNAIGTVTLTGAGDTVAAGNGAATVDATAANEVILGGAGALFGNLAGAGDSLIGAAGAVSATVSGSGDAVVGGVGALAANVSGSGDTILAGGGAAAVTLAGGATDAVVQGGTAAMSVLDNGAGDTINAGLSFTSVTAPGGSFVRGGSGPLNFLGGTGPSTILGGSGNATVFGGSAETSIFGSPGAAIQYVNTVPGGLSYQAGAGSETIDASLSKGVGGSGASTSSFLFGGSDIAGHNLLIAGQGDQFLTAGKGSDTMVGGGGVSSFWFWNTNGGPAANDFITNFSAIDNVVLAGYGSGAAGAALAGATTLGSSTTITLSDSTKITFIGVNNPAALSDHIFSF
jgi:Ca2+-binding RTX toxin-like protein